MYDPDTDAWREGCLSGERPQADAVYVADTDAAWLSDFGTLWSASPWSGACAALPLPSRNGNVR